MARTKLKTEAVAPADPALGALPGAVEAPEGDPAASLSFRQRHILNYIRTSITTRGYPPTMREIGHEVGLTSPSSVKHQLVVLERKGYLRRDPNLPRAIEVIDPTGEQGPLRPHGVSGYASMPGNVLSMINGGLEAGGDFASTMHQPAFVPLVGRIAAGGPILAEQSIEDVFALPKQLVGDGDVFMLKVAGDSMIDAALCNDDWVVVRRQPNAENGEMVAAMLDGEATVKILQKDRDHVWLMPRNDNYEPILGDEAQILGRIVAVLRSV